MLYFIKVIQKDEKTYYILERYNKYVKTRDSLFINRYVAGILVNGGIKMYSFDENNNRVEVSFE